MPVSAEKKYVSIKLHVSSLKSVDCQVCPASVVFNITVGPAYLPTA